MRRRLYTIKHSFSTTIHTTTLMPLQDLYQAMDYCHLTYDPEDGNDSDS